jgi:hypothetical protein
LPQWRDVEIYGMQQLIFTVYKAFYDWKFLDVKLLLFLIIFSV